jgi:hypothetical protein
VPSSFAFVPADQGARIFIDGGVFSDSGNTDITATDAAGLLAPGTMTLTVLPPDSIATLSTGRLAFLALALALTGLWLARLRR